MDDTAFYVVPIATMEPDSDWESLSRAQRLARIEQQLKALDAAIRLRLPGMTVELKAGAGGWTISSPDAVDRELLANKLQGLPVSVAPDERYYAI